MKNKTFDCVKMKRAAAEEIYREVKDLTPEETRAYWRALDKVILQRKALLQQQKSSDSAANDG